MSTWDLYVLGGIDVPRFLIGDVNFCSNPYFNTGITGWSESSGGIFSRDNIQLDALGEYMGKIEYTLDEQYVEYSYDMGVSVTGRKFFLILRSKSISDWKVAFYGNSEFGSTNFAHSNDINTYVAIVDASTQTGTTIKIRIYGTQSNVDSAELYFDDVYFSEIFNDMEMPQPQVSYMPVEKIQFGENYLWNGNIQQFSKRFRPGYFANWEYLIPEYEVYRQKIAAAQIVVCIPHKDISFGFRCIWNKDFSRKYFHNRFLGHSGIISLKGTQFITSMPTVQSTEEALYIFTDELII